MRLTITAATSHPATPTAQLKQTHSLDAQPVAFNDAQTRLRPLENVLASEPAVNCSQSLSPNTLASH